MEQLAIMVWGPHTAIFVCAVLLAFGAGLIDMAMDEVSEWRQRRAESATASDEALAREMARDRVERAVTREFPIPVPPRVKEFPAVVPAKGLIASGTVAQVTKALSAAPAYYVGGGVFDVRLAKVMAACPLCEGTPCEWHAEEATGSTQWHPVVGG